MWECECPCEPVPISALFAGIEVVVAVFFYFCFGECVVSSEVADVDVVCFHCFSFVVVISFSSTRFIFFSFSLVYFLFCGDCGGHSGS